MRRNGLRRKDGIGTAGMYESVTEAAKNGFSSSGRNALNVEVLEPVPTNSKRARCFGISSGRQRIRTAKKGAKTNTPVDAPVPDALPRAHVDVRDAPRGALLVRVGKSIRDHDELVVRPDWRVLIADEDDARQTALPLRCTIDRRKGRGMHVFRGVVRARWEALKDRVLPVSRPEQRSKEIKLGL
jgi:hypothetical protein